MATEVIELIDGFILGALEKEQVTSLETCVADLNPMINEIVTAI